MARPQRLKLTKQEVRRRIYLSGGNGDYRVHHNIPGLQIICYVPSAKLGHIIVRALRDTQK